MRIVICTASQTYGQPDTMIVADDRDGRREASAHIGAHRLVWRRWHSSDGYTEVVGIAVPPGTVIPPDSESLPYGIDRWCELERDLGDSDAAIDE